MSNCFMSERMSAITFKRVAYPTIKEPESKRSEKCLICFLGQS